VSKQQQTASWKHCVPLKNAEEEGNDVVRLRAAPQPRDA
jgi:hypothetical protein